MPKRYLYLQAAKIKYSNQHYGACDAIDLAAGDEVGHTGPAAKRFVELFRPEDSPFLYWGEEWGATLEEVNDCRVLALLFMHAIEQESSNV